MLRRDLKNDKTVFIRRQAVLLLTAGMLAAALPQTAQAETYSAEPDGGASQVELSLSAEDRSRKEVPARIAICTVEEGSFAYVRSEPSTESEYVGKLFSGSACVIIAEDVDWYLVSSGEVIGYVSVPLLTEADEFLCSLCQHDAVRVLRETCLTSEADPGVPTETVVDAGSEWRVTAWDLIEIGMVRIDGPEGAACISLEDAEVIRTFDWAISRKTEAYLEEIERSRVPMGQQVLDYATQFLGCPYVYGGTSLTNGCDCSGFVMSVYAHFGVSMAHSSSAQRGVGYAVSAADVMPGDIVCYSGHVGIYAGNGQIIAAATPAQGICYSPMYFSTPVAIRRVF